jgi:2-C-methyl-D-erythritol 4-phosphate cytidylyltransferase
MSKFAAILPAAGRSTRFKKKDDKKQFAMLANRAVWMHAAEHFLNRDDTPQVIVVIAPEDREYFEFKFSANAAVLGIQVVEGGAERADSVQRALDKVRDEIDFICVHDAARPCLASEWIDKVYQAAQQHGAAILALPIAGTVKRVNDEQQIVETVPREGLWEAQTPQVFRRELLVEAYAKRDGFAATDEAQMVERRGHPVRVVRGSPINLKITTGEDLHLAAHALKALPKPRLSGPGHPFADDMWR